VTADKPRAVAAIDFGTHGSGYAWAVLDPRHVDPASLGIAHNRAWTANTDQGAPKTRTALLVDEDGSVARHGSEALQEFYDRRASDVPTGVVLENFKVALKIGPGGYPVRRPDPALSALRRSRMSVDTAVTEFLRWMYDFAVADMRARLVRPEDVEWCLTVPAIWSDAEKQRMREAAVAAGMPGDRLLLALEPEAAAIYVHLSQGTLPSAVGDEFDLHNPGSRFMVVDAGGGTVDISAYRVTDTGGLAEIGRATGERLGSQYLNQGFKDLVGERLGGHDVAHDLATRSPAEFAQLVADWEQAKRPVRYEQVASIVLRLSADLRDELKPEERDSLAAAQGGKTGSLIIKPKEIKKIFGAAVDPVKSYIDRQLDEMASETGVRLPEETVVLVGGFAASEYLREALVRHLAGRARVIRAPLPEIAVLYGAVHFARDPQLVEQRKVTQTWGIRVTTKFEPDVHDDRRAATIDGRRAVELFKVFVDNGAAVQANVPVVHTVVPFTENQRLVIDLYSTGATKPTYLNEPGSTLMRSMAIDLSEEEMRLPREQREVEVAMYFGRTQLEVRATSVLSREEKSMSTRYAYRVEET
jgi:molecular chaperone DnaK (HSP70)